MRGCLTEWKANCEPCKRFRKRTTPGARATGGFYNSNLANLAWRFLQIIMACVVIGFYAKDLNAARKVHKYADSKWVKTYTN